MDAVKKSEIFGKFASVNRLTICVNQLTRCEQASVGKFIGVNRLNICVNRLTRCRKDFPTHSYRR